MLDDKTGADLESPTMRELIDAVVAKYGSYRKAAAALGVDHQLLHYYGRKGHKIADAIQLFEKIKKALKLSQADALKLTKK